MSDQDLRDKLASEGAQKGGYTDGPGHYEGVAYREAFKAGWDAARANPLRDEKRLWDDCERLRKERDELKAEVERLKEEAKNQAFVASETAIECERQLKQKLELRAAVEKLAEALELYKDQSCPVEIQTDGSKIWSFIAAQALVEYRKQFPLRNNLSKNE